MESWVPGAAVGLLGSFAAWILSWRINSEQREAAEDVALTANQQVGADLRIDIKEFRQEMREAIDEIREKTSLSIAWQASQDKVNLYTSKAIESIVATQDRHGEKLNDHAATLKLLTTLITQQQK